MTLGVSERKTVRLHSTGASRSAVLPAAWLKRHGIGDRALLVETEDGILITSVEEPVDGIEAEPEFPRFLEFVARDALARPERLIDPARRLSRGRALARGVETD